MQNQNAQRRIRLPRINSIAPDDPRNYGNFGNVLASENKIDEAIPIYLTALKFNPNDYQTEFNLGLTYARAGKKAEAESHYREALRIKPDYQEAKKSIGATANRGMRAATRVAAKSFPRWSFPGNIRRHSRSFAESPRHPKRRCFSKLHCQT